FVLSNGLTDAPAVDLEITDVEPVFALPLGDMTGYRTMPNFDPLIEVFRNGSPLPSIISHIVSIPFVLGKSFVLYTSGFDNPELNRNGSKAELMLALNNGAVVQLKARETVLPFSRLQLIHASPDPTLQLVDLYLDEFRVGDDAEFRSGTPFFDVFTGKTVTVGIAPSNSADFREIVISSKVIFDEKTSASAVVRGLLNPDSFAPNPDGLNTAFGVHVISDVLERGPDASQVTVLVTTEITDAPTMNAMLDTSVPYATDLAFSEAGSYGLVSADQHSFDFRDVATDNRVAKSFVEFFGLRGRAGILVASGFVDSTDVNQNGAAFSSFLVLDDGSTRRYDRIFTSIESAPHELPTEMTLRGAYPNPFSTEASVLFDLPEPATVSLQLFDVTGRRVGQVEPRLVAAGRDRSVKLVVPGLSSGMYFYRLTATGVTGSHSAQGELMLVR
ncbi:MAG: T9SS type A sorting domain-containing protein, partial [Rhodothermia bacterium]